MKKSFPSLFFYSHLWVYMPNKKLLIGILVMEQECSSNLANGTLNVVDDGQLSTNEGCSSISDRFGNLLFYSDGTTVWNRNHIVMQNGNGLFGDSSSTQSAIIVPKPDDQNIYYIFTVDNALDGNNFGLNYSIIDISLDGGFGAVTEKNINLITTVF